MALLAMATGALAMPQASNADIIFTDLTANPISIFGTNGSMFLITLPGTAQLGFCGHTIVSPPMTLRQSITASQKGFGYVRLKTDGHAFLQLAGRGLTWNQFRGTQTNSVNATAATAKLNMHSPDSFDHMYMLFKFKDSNLPPLNNLRYGWVDLSLSNANGAIPELTIFGYAYDDTGAEIPTGATVIPELAPMALLALGALTLGARGLRTWRRNRIPASS